MRPDATRQHTLRISLGGPDTTGYVPEENEQYGQREQDDAPARQGH